MEELENEIVTLLNRASSELSSDEFNMLSESIIDYLDEIGGSNMNEDLGNFTRLI